MMERGRKKYDNILRIKIHYYSGNGQAGDINIYRVSLILVNI